MTGRGERRKPGPEPGAEGLLAAAAMRLLDKRRLLIATNRGPMTFVTAADGSLRPRRGSGGLVTALSQAARHVPVTWIAAAMTDGDRRAAADPSLIERAAPGDDVRLRFAAVDRPVFEAAYNVIANPLLWFLQHQMWNLPERPVIDAAVMRAWEHGYVPLNDAFASAVLAQSPRSDPSSRRRCRPRDGRCAARPRPSACTPARTPRSPHRGGTRASSRPA